MRTQAILTLVCGIGLIAVGCSRPAPKQIADAEDSNQTISDTAKEASGESAPEEPAPPAEEAPASEQSNPEKTGENEEAVETPVEEASSQEAAAQATAPAEDADAEQSEPETQVASEPPATAVAAPTSAEVTSQWNQWGGSSQRNNTPVGANIPAEWEVGEIDFDTGQWNREGSKNIKWVARVGSQSYGNPVVADGKVFVGTNNGAAYLERYPEDVDLGCLLCFNEADGKFLWQHSSEKLATGRVHDWPLQGICCAPLVEGDRLWFVTSRGEVRCLDTSGFHDDENDGPYKDETYTTKDEADVVWVFDMMKELKTSQHNMCSCSVTSSGDFLFVNTSNGLDESHINLPAPDAPSFFAMNKNTGEVYWTDASPGKNILHGQWSSPACGELGGVPQVIFGGGDGWVYSFKADVTAKEPELLWKFDANPKETKWVLGGQGTRNNIIATPVIHDGLVYVAVGQDPEHGEGVGHLWAIDPTKRGDVSPELAFNVDDLEHPIPPKRIQAVVAEDGEVSRPNPNTAVVWHYSQFDQDGDGEYSFEETMHRSCGTVAIKDNLLFIADFSGLFHCLDLKTGQPYWTYDMFAAAWGSPLIVDDKVYIGDEDGDVSIFTLSKEMDQIAEINMGNSVYSTPIVAKNVLYIANKTHLFAIAPDTEVAQREGNAQQQ
ncbi:MAG: PQQ-binding-like beta-propeller repeat protein [Planctomycetales bacterium]|nr:PQQ-binding-like beta-propeller repeat protein [Planctomycetales bacterium]